MIIGVKYQLSISVVRFREKNNIKKNIEKPGSLHIPGA